MPSLHCPHCGKSVVYGEQHLGKRLRCPGCDGAIEFPSSLPPDEATPATTSDEATRQDASEDSSPDDMSALLNAIYLQVNTILGETQRIRKRADSITTNTTIMAAAAILCIVLILMSLFVSVINFAVG